MSSNKQLFIHTMKCYLYRSGGGWSAAQRPGLEGPRRWGHARSPSAASRSPRRRGHRRSGCGVHLSFICSIPFLPSFQKSTHSLTHQTSSEASCLPGPELRSGEREKFDWFPDVGSLIALGRWVWSSRHGHRPGLFSVVGETVPRGPCESPE